MNSSSAATFVAGLSVSPYLTDSMAASAVTRKFSVSLVLDPQVLAQLPPVYLEMLLGADGSPNASAMLENFRFTGGVMSKYWMNYGASGNCSSSVL